MRFPLNATYGEVCSELLHRGARRLVVSESSLADRIGLPSPYIPAELTSADLPFDQAMELAEVADANEFDRASLELAWVQTRPRKHALTFLWRTFVMLGAYRAEVGVMDTFLKRHGLSDEYAAWRSTLE